MMAFEQPIGLGCGDRADACVQQVGAPAAHVALGDVSDGSESGRKVAA